MARLRLRSALALLLLMASLWAIVSVGRLPTTSRPKLPKQASQAGMVTHQLCNRSAGWLAAELLPGVRLVVFSATAATVEDSLEVEVVLWVADSYSLADVDNDHAHALISPSAELVLAQLWCLGPSNSSSKPAILAPPESSSFLGASRSARKLVCRLQASPSDEQASLTLRWEQPTWNHANPVAPAVHDLELELCRARPGRSLVAVCSPVLQSNIPPGRLLEYVFYYLELGAAVVHLADREGSYRQVLAPLVRRGLVEYQELPRFEPRIEWHYFDQVIVNNACLARMRSQAEWLLFVDQDEYLQLHHPGGWAEWLRGTDAPALSLSTWDFLGEHIYFPYNELKYLNDNNPYRSVLSQTVRSARPNSGVREKPLVRADCAEFVEVHKVLQLKPGCGAVQDVDPVGQARLNHYGKFDAHPGQKGVEDEGLSGLDPWLTAKVTPRLIELKKEALLPDVYAVF